MNQKARVIEVKIGVKTYWYVQIQKNNLGLSFWKYWDSLGGVDLSDGSVYWCKKLEFDILYAEKTLRNYEELFGVTLDITVVKLK